MDDQDKIFLETDDEPDFTQFAQQAVEGGGGTGPEGDMAWGVDDATDDPVGKPEAPNARRTPIRGSYAYLSVPLGMDLYLGFSAFDEGQKLRERQGELDPTEWSAYPEADRLVMWVQGMMARDIERDEKSPEPQRLYYFSGLFRGLTYRKLIVDPHLRGMDAKLRERDRLRRQQQIARVQQKMGPEWTEDAVEDLLGPEDFDD